jgi:hypothetical protein
MFYHHFKPINVPNAGAQAFVMNWPTKRTGHNPPWRPSADWVLTTANTAGTSGLTCFSKHWKSRDNTFLAYPMIDQSCLTSATRDIELLELFYVCVQIILSSPVEVYLYITDQPELLEVLLRSYSTNTDIQLLVL